MEPEIVTEIKNALRSSRTAEEVEQVAAKYRPRVREMSDDPDLKVFVTQIVNLKYWKLKLIEEDEHDQRNSRD